MSGNNSAGYGGIDSAWLTNVAGKAKDNRDILLMAQNSRWTLVGQPYNKLSDDIDIDLVQL